jgi:signal transduction histidine kinase/ActR/RegA family two-component response regulator
MALMSKHHRILERQVRKHLAAAYLHDPAIQNFLEIISSTYEVFERDKKISDYAFAVNEKEYLELQAALIEAKELAEKASKAKGDFLSVMSHEIRTPLNAITGIAHLLQQDEHLPQQEENINALTISADNLLHLINDILDFNKIEEGKILFSEKNINLRQVIANIKMAQRINAGEKGTEIKVMIDEELPQSIKADDVRLGQILNNLVSNAVKFTANGTVTIEVVMRGWVDDKAQVYFAVSDTGIGIEPAKLPLIFERFTQANSDITRQFGGSGLGLAIVKKLLNLQNSDVGVESEPGKGSKFYFTLLFSMADAVVMEDAGSAIKQSLQGLKVLLVEDVEFNILVAKKILSSWNAEVDVAVNGQIAVEKMRNSQYDIVLMDLQMPVMDGYTASTNIRKFNKEIPIIALTAEAIADIQSKAMHHGMTDYVSKPFNPKDLFRTIYNHTYKIMVKAG